MLASLVSDAGSEPSRSRQHARACPQATSISPWVVTLEALQRFRCARPARAPDPARCLGTRPERHHDCMQVVGQQAHGMPARARPVLDSLARLGKGAQEGQVLG